MRITAIVWNSHAATLAAGATLAGNVDLELFTSRQLNREPELVEKALASAASAQVVFLYRTSDAFWTEIDAGLKNLPKGTPVVCLSHDPSFWALSSVSLGVVQTCNNYLTHGGSENAASLLHYLAHELLGEDQVVQAPQPLPWEGLYHPAAPRRHYADRQAYLDWYEGYAASRGLTEAPRVGLLFTRHYWINDQLSIENALIQALEDAGLKVLPVFSYSLRDPELGSRGSAAVVEEMFLDEGQVCIDAMVKLQAFFLGRAKGDDSADESRAGDGVALLSRLGVPVFQPIVSFSQTIEEWERDSQGLGSDIGWTVAMPEFEGVIEPFLLGAMERSDSGEGELEDRRPIPERCIQFARRVARWARLRRKSPRERRVAFVLHNAPCASVEATVGSAAGLDALESVARLMKRMEESGYGVNPPRDGAELVGTIMARKAISEFRWTTVEEIVAKGGALAQVDMTTYGRWFADLPEEVRARMCQAWGDPPGAEVNGMPPAMVHEGKILVTGVDYGQAVVCVQPKRGCAGARCDGAVCKILHDPEVPPPHQFLATYRWLQEEFDADVLIHVGTHGTLEFLPGKGVGLSRRCLPDLVLDALPHLYIYNADNAPEGTIAKRRSYATLIDHMQAPLIQGGLYDDLEELDRTLGEWEQARRTDPGRAHVLEHIIGGLLEHTKLTSEPALTDWHDRPFAEVARVAHEALGRIRNTQIQDGMHVLGSLPQGLDRVRYVHAVLRHDAGVELSPRKLAARLAALELKDLLTDPGQVDALRGKSHGRLLEEVDSLALRVVEVCLEVSDDRLLDTARERLGPLIERDEALSELPELAARVRDLAQRLDASQEDLALLDAMAGGYVPAGPSGLIFRGRDDILPTGRNFFSLDPERVPTRAAAVIGRNLAQALIDKHLKDEGRLPENVAIYWMCADIMWSDGEGMAQIMNFLGVRPKWLPNGRVRDFEIIPLGELGRPRIDVTLRASGITRDNFPDRIKLLDRAIQAVAALDEPVELNYVRKHTLEQLAAKGEGVEDLNAFRRASLRIFSAAPGTYRAGVNLAVYASAWKEAADLSDIFVFWNGYAYGEDVFGEMAHAEFAHALKSVDVTFNKVMNDAHDLFGCCGYFGNHGGLSVASSTLSGRSVRNYYGDTRESEAVEVRDLGDEIRRVVRTKLLNPKWIEGMKRHGYKGAGDISKRIGRVYGWEAATGEVDNWVFDDIVKTFVQDGQNRKFFEEHNPWALEEIGRRLLEAESRGLWQADPDILRELRERYLEMEGWIEERTGEIGGDFQGGSVDILVADDVPGWGQAMAGVRDLVRNLAGGKR